MIIMKDRELKLEELDKVVGGICKPQAPKPFKERSTADLIACLENCNKANKLYMSYYENEGRSSFKETADKFKSDYNEVSAILVDRINTGL